MFYSLTLEDNILRIGFADLATNREIVREIDEKLLEMKKSGQLYGPLLKINGAASIPAAFTIAHAVNHLYGAVAVFDPKLGEHGMYVVCVSHNPRYLVGDLIS